MDNKAAVALPPLSSAATETRVTVVIPTYNRAQLLAGAIESVLAQTWPYFRLIVSDNVSTDETPEIVAGFDDPRISYVRLDEHLELDAHFNLWFARGSGDYLLTLADDDRMAPDLLETAVEVLDRNSRAGVVHGQTIVVDGDGAVIAAGHSMTGLSADAVESGEEFIRQTMDMSIRVYGPTALVRTDAVSGLQLDQRDVPSDLGFWLRMALDWEMAFVARPLASYRIHRSAASAGLADVGKGGYTNTADAILKAYEVKARFVHENSERLRDPEKLLRSARRGLRRDLLVRVARVTLPERGLRATVRELFEACRVNAGILLEPGAWRLLAGSLLGPRGTSAAKRMFRR